MKKYISFLVILILFQSCYSYKIVENNSTQYEVGKIYRVKQNGKSSTVKITTKTDSTLVVWSKFENKTLTVNEISKAERRKFSIVKTVILPVVIVGVVAVILASSVSIKTGPIQSPP